MARIKGTSLTQTVAALKAQPAAAARVDPRYRKFLEVDDLSVAEWYPEEVQVELLRPLVQAQGGGDAAWQLMGSRTALYDLGRVYKHLLRAGDPAATVRKMPVLWSSYHDTGKLTVTIPAPGEAHYELAGYGAPSPEMCSINAGYFRGMLKLAGARDIEVTHGTCVHRGGEHCVWHAKWTDPAA